MPWNLGWTPNGKEVIYRRYDPDSTVRTVAADVVTGATRVLASWTHARPQDMIGEMSPDGRLIAQVVPTEDHQGTALRVTDLAGNSARELLRVRMPDELSTIDWAADGRHIYVVRANLADAAPGSPARGSLRVDRVSVADGATRTLQFGMTGNYTPIAVHPDGRRIYFVAGHAANELWELAGWDSAATVGACAGGRTVIPSQMSGSLLVVDDDAVVREALVEALAEAGYDVRAADDGARAVALLAERAPDVVLSDVRMPGMDGLALLALLRERAPDIPVLLMTAFDDMPTVVAAMREGATDFLVKPLDLHELRARVARVIDDRRARARAARGRRGEEETPPQARGPRGARPAHDRDLQARGSGGRDSRERPHSRRERHRQGADRASHPRPLARGGRAVRADQLHRSAGDAARERAVRPRARRVHGRAGGSPWQVRARRTRRDLPRRDRRHLGRLPDEAPPRAAGAAVLPGGRGPAGAHRGARDRRDASRPRGDGGGGTVPRGPVLSAPRRRDRGAAAPRARGRPAVARGDARAPRRGRRGAARAGARARRAGGTRAARVAGQRARAGELPNARGRRGERRRHPRRAPRARRRGAGGAGKARHARRAWSASTCFACSPPRGATRRARHRSSASRVRGSTAFSRATTSAPMADTTAARPPRETTSRLSPNAAPTAAGGVGHQNLGYRAAPIVNHAEAVAARCARSSFSWCSPPHWCRSRCSRSGWRARADARARRSSPRGSTRRCCRRPTRPESGGWSTARHCSTSRRRSRCAARSATPWAPCPHPRSCPTAVRVAIVRDVAGAVRWTRAARHGHAPVAFSVRCSRSGRSAR